jgi:glycosyltransferase involved in cell wall biosynthesis
MKILHLSDDGLPDWRVEKAALTGKRDGHSIYFGGRIRNVVKSDLFNEIFPISWSAWSMIGFPYLWHVVKKQVANCIRIVRPDIVHAHNIASARMVSGLGLPTVFDDHEYFKVYSKVLVENRKPILYGKKKSLVRGLIRRSALSFLNSQTVSVWTRWEEELVSKHPTITVSEQIAYDLKRSISNKVFVVPNYPMKFESEDFFEPRFQKKLSTAYAGGDIKNIQITNRDISNLAAIFDKGKGGQLTIIGWEPESTGYVRATGFLSRIDMFREMSNHSIGLIPWKKHWSHKFVSPNKAYEYAHAGLFVGVTSDITPVIQNLRENCFTFENYNDLEAQLEYFGQNLEELYNKRINTYRFAKKNLIWENFDRNIIEAYRLC